MPNNQSEGMLEDFLLSLIPYAARSFAKKAAEEAIDKKFGNYIPEHKSKAVAHTYLAWQHVPGNPLEAAIRVKSFEVKEQNVFVEWLKAFFGAVAA